MPVDRANRLNSIKTLHIDGMPFRVPLADHMMLEYLTDKPSDAQLNDLLMFYPDNYGLFGVLDRVQNLNKQYRMFYERDLFVVGKAGPNPSIALNKPILMGFKDRYVTFGPHPDRYLPERPGEDLEFKRIQKPAPSRHSHYKKG